MAFRVWGRFCDKGPPLQEPLPSVFALFTRRRLLRAGTPQENRLGIDGTLSLIAKYEINLKDGYLNSYRRLDNDETGREYLVRVPGCI